MKFSLPENTHFVVLETSISDYIKSRAKVLQEIVKQKMEKLFDAKMIYNKDEKITYNPHSMFFHIMLNGDNIGYFVCIPGLYKGSVWISEFFIDEDYRNKGYGTLALNKIKEILKNKHYTSIALSYTSNNDAERLYIKNGFVNKLCTDVMCKL